MSTRLTVRKKSSKIKSRKPAFVVKDESLEKRIVMAEVYAPDIPDSDGEYMTAEEIEKMAHRFLLNGRVSEVDIQHDGEDAPGCTVVESFIARKGDDQFIEGSWVVAMHIDNDEVWNQIKKKEINGFSMEALVVKEPVEVVELDVPPVVAGLTTKEEDHEHKFYVSYDADGMFRGGRTDVINGHYHEIKAGTITETAAGHCHKFCAVDDVCIAR